MTNIINNNSLFKDIYSIDMGVIELKLSDFTYNNITKKLYINNKYFENKKGFIIFYSPWCTHCKKISELIIDLALANIYLFHFGAINSENIKDGNDKLFVYANITNLPTIKYIKQDSSLEDYNFAYTMDNLLYFININ